MGYIQRNDQIKFYNRFEFDRNSYPKESLLRSRDSHISIFQTMTTDGKKSPKGVWTKTELSFKSNFNLVLSRKHSDWLYLGRSLIIYQSCCPLLVATVAYIVHT